MKKLTTRRIDTELLDEIDDLYIQSKGKITLTKALEDGLKNQIARYRKEYPKDKTKAAR